MLKKKPNPRLLRGGAKDVEVGEIKRLRMISDLGTEADVMEVEVEHKGKKMRFAEKASVSDVIVPKDSRYNPVLQQRIFKELKSLNRDLQLGLHLPTTFRLRDAGEKKPRIVTTLYDIPEDVKGVEVDDFERQQKVLKALNWSTRIDNYHPVMVDGKVVAMLTDFGGIMPPKDVVERIRSDIPEGKLKR